jgi:hypothetical protein
MGSRATGRSARFVTAGTGAAVPCASSHHHFPAARQQTSPIRRNDLLKPLLPSLAERWPLVRALVATAPPAAYLWLLLEAGHRLGIGPTRTIQVVVVLVAIFLQPASHVAFSLVPSESTTAHLTISVVAGATRADMVGLMFRMASRSTTERLPAMAPAKVNT